RDALDALEGMDSPLGTFGFDDNRDPAHAPVVLVVKDGVFAVFQP
ncbi:ABC transporter substrate-binding protein, partial [bacterium]|nr:ABC transporter substrate-binding protein [bacterium]